MTRIPSQSELQELLDKKNHGGVRQLVEEEPKRYSRGAEKTNRIWVRLRCTEHGIYPTETRLDTIIKSGTKCKQCAFERGASLRRRPYQQVEDAVKKWAQERMFPVRLLGLSDDHKTAFLECEIHGEKIRRTGKVVDKGQLCDECVDQSGKNSPNHIPFEMKKKMYKERYNPPPLELTKENEEGVWYICPICKKSFPASWSNIYNQGNKTCRLCSYKIKEHLDVNIIGERLNKLGIRIVDNNDYEGTHYKTEFQCTFCGYKKATKANTIFNLGGMPCNCTKSIPDRCHDLIANHLIRNGNEVICEFRLNDGKTYADIFVKNLNTIIEVKYGDTPFGRSNSHGHAKARYEHTQDQLERYRTTNYKIIYMIVGDSKKVELQFPFPPEVTVLYLDTMSKNNLLADKDLLSQLSDLYNEPYKVKGLEIKSLDKENTRETLRNYLLENNLIYPSQKQIKSLLGMSNRKVNNALGLGRHATLKESIEACQYWFNLKVNSHRKKYITGKTRAQEIKTILELIKKYLINKNGVYPSKKEWKEYSGYNMTSLDLALGIEDKNNILRREKCRELFGLEITFKSEKYLHKTIEAERIRKKLLAFITENNMRYPYKREIRPSFGIGWIRLDSYLGLQQPVSQKMRHEAVKEWFNIEIRD